MQWHQFPGVPGILLATQIWGLAGDACMHSRPLQKYYGTKRLFPANTCLIYKPKIKCGDSDYNVMDVSSASIVGNNLFYFDTTT